MRQLSIQSTICVANAAVEYSIHHLCGKCGSSIHHLCGNKTETPTSRCRRRPAKTSCCLLYCERWTHGLTCPNLFPTRLTVTVTKGITLLLDKATNDPSSLIQTPPRSFGPRLCPLLVAAAGLVEAVEFIKHRKPLLLCVAAS